MPPAEWPVRVQEQVRLKLDAVNLRGFHPPPHLRRQPVPRFPVPRGAPPLLPPVNELLASELPLLGRKYSALDNWYGDPDTGTVWRTANHRRDSRDVKLVWELHRLPHLQILALAGRSRPEARDLCLRLLESWLNLPVFDPVFYSCATECAYRILALLLIAGWLEELPERLRVRFWDHLLANVHQVRRYPSRFSSANNHRVSELVALFCVGALVPELRDPDVLPELVQVTETLIDEHGIGAEQSPDYLALILEWLLVARQVGTHCGEPPPLDDLLIRGAGWLRSMMDETGRVPQIGDSDDSVAMRFQLAPENLVRSVCACISHFAPDVAPPGPADLRTWALSLPPSPESSVAGEFRSSAYTVLRRENAVLTIDHGPLGFGRLAAHGHADALSIWLSVGGTQVFIDPGTYVYNTQPKWRSWLRSAAAHSTVTFADQEPVRSTGPFTWSGRLDALHTPCPNGVIAWHHGYGSRLQRTVTWDDGVIVVHDEGESLLRSHLLVSPDLAVEETDRGVCITGANVTIDMNGTQPIEVHRGTGAIGPGMCSAQYGLIAPTTSLIQQGARSLTWTICVRRGGTSPSASP